MEHRITRFIAGLRAMGVRVSVAESQDAWRAIENLGITDREQFKLLLRSTLVKDYADYDTFDELFPLYFGNEPPPLLNPRPGGRPRQHRADDGRGHAGEGVQPAAPERHGR